MLARKLIVLRGMKALGKTVLSLCVGILSLSKIVYGSESLQGFQALIDDGKYVEAVDALSDYLKDHADDARALKLRALSQSGLGRFDDAVEDYEKILEERPNDAETQLDLGMILALKKKDAKHALVHLDRYLSLREGGEAEARAAAIMVSVDGRRSRTEEKVAEDLLDMAKEFESEGHVKGAIRAYERVLAIHPTCAVCHESLGKLLIQNRDQSEGERHLAKAKLFQNGG